ncbi:MAG: putative 2OG-Fe(II) oxygenase [Rhizomicrobium sp.]
MDRFDDAIDALRTADLPRSYDRLMLLGAAHLARKTPDDNAAAHVAFTSACEMAGTPGQLAQALAEVGKVLLRLNKTRDARTILLQAMSADPANADAFRRLALLDLKTGRAQDAFEWSEMLIARDIVHTHLLVMRALALTALDRIDEARAAFGLARFGHEGELPAPDGWSSIATFNCELAAEIRNHPALRYGRTDTAAVASWRVDTPLLRRSVLFPQLLSVLKREIVAHVTSLAAGRDAFSGLRPHRAMLNAWSVLTLDDGYEDWHIHPSGWFSGVYYVEVPAAVRAGTERHGCLAFGAPPDIVGSRQAERLGTHLFRPQPGRFMLFPSHNYHRTYAHGGSECRICVAFDVVPDNDRPTADRHGDGLAL